MLWVGQHIAGFDLEHILGRERHADDAQIFPATIDDGGELVAEVDVVSLQKSFAGEDFVIAPDRKLPPAAQIKLVQPRKPRDGERDQLPNSGLGEAGHIQRHLFDDPSFHFGDAGDFGEAIDHGVWRALDSGEDIGKAVPFIERGSREFE